MRWLKILVFGGGGLLAIWIILRFTGMLRPYTVPTGSNEPTVMKDSHIFSSNLLTPKRGDFICYKYHPPEGMADIWMKRLCGMPGDTLQIKEGVLYINGKNADEGRNLKFMYKIPSRILYALKLKREDIQMFSETEDSIVVLLDQARAKKIGLKVKQMRRPGQMPLGYEKYDPSWTNDFFGPYVVPQGYYFVMGDSRDNSEDSRYTGPVPKEDVVGVVVGK